MSEQQADLDAALERVVIAARAHLGAVRAANGRADDEGVWAAYAELSAASYDYDELLMDQFDEVTPWNVAELEDERNPASGGEGSAEQAEDPYPVVVSVRQRRDYRVPSVAALFALAEQARASAGTDDDHDHDGHDHDHDDDVDGPVETISEAILELLQAGDGSLAALDVPELEPLDGIVVIAEVDEVLDLDSFQDSDGSGPFAVGPADRLVGRLDEHPFVGDDIAG